MRDLSDILGRQTLDLPVNGRVYSVPEVDARTGLLIQQVMGVAMDAENGKDIDEERVGRIVLSDEDENALYPRVLSQDVWDEMLADGVGWEYLKHCAMVVMIWVIADRKTAEDAWEKGPEPGEGPAPNRAARRAASRSAGASTTRSRASTSGTTSRAKKTVSPGRPSSRTSAS